MEVILIDFQFVGIFVKKCNCCDLGLSEHHPYHLYDPVHLFLCHLRVERDGKLFK